MSLTYSDSFAATKSVSSIRRNPVAIVFVVLLHAVMFYGFTHGMKVIPIISSTDIKLVDVAPLPPETPPAPQIKPPKTVPEQSLQTTELQVPAPTPELTVTTVPEVSSLNESSDAVGVGPEVPNNDAALSIMRRVDPVYPAAARRAGEQGTVVLSVMVDPSGHVSAATVLSSSGSMTLDDAALAAIKRWQFSPHNSGTVQVRVPITFRLQSVRF